MTNENTGIRLKCKGIKYEFDSELMPISPSEWNFVYIPIVSNSETCDKDHSKIFPEPNQSSNYT
jgi:hypothetical protein